MCRKCAPIAIFTYNRPEHLKKTIDALKGNVLAEESDVFVFSDGSKGVKDAEEIAEVRRYAKEIRGFNSVTLVEREVNYGCKKNIIGGIEALLERFGRVIVVEDDIVTSKWFLKYMNDSLEKYAENERVMAISAFLPPIDFNEFEDSFFSEVFECQGWATWKRTWDLVEFDAKKLVQTTSSKQIKRINSGGVDYWKQVMYNYKGKLNTWAIFFHVAVLLHDGLVLYNKQHLCINIGFDGSGVHCGANSNAGGTVIGDEQVVYFPDIIEINKKANDKILEYYQKEADDNTFIKRGIRVFKQEGIKGILRKLIKRIK